MKTDEMHSIRHLNPEQRNIGNGSCLFNWMMVIFIKPIVGMLDYLYEYAVNKNICSSELENIWMNNFLDGIFEIESLMIILTLQVFLPSNYQMHNLAFCVTWNWCSAYTITWSCHFTHSKMKIIFLHMICFSRPLEISIII